MHDHLFLLEMWSYGFTVKNRNCIERFCLLMLPGAVWNSFIMIKTFESFRKTHMQKEVENHTCFPKQAWHINRAMRKLLVLFQALSSKNCHGLPFQKQKFQQHALKWQLLNLKVFLETFQVLNLPVHLTTYLPLAITVFLQDVFPVDSRSKCSVENVLFWEILSSHCTKYIASTTVSRTKYDFEAV